MPSPLLTNFPFSKCSKWVTCTQDPPWRHMFRFLFSQTCPIYAGYLHSIQLSLPILTEQHGRWCDADSADGEGEGEVRKPLQSRVHGKSEKGRGSTHSLWFPTLPTATAPTMCPRFLKPSPICWSHHGCAVSSVSQTPSVSLHEVNSFIRLLWKLSEIKYRQMFLYFWRELRPDKPITTGRCQKWKRQLINATTEQPSLATQCVQRISCFPLWLRNGLWEWIFAQKSQRIGPRRGTQGKDTNSQLKAVYTECYHCDSYHTNPPNILENAIER